MAKKTKNICITYRPFTPHALRVARDVGDWIKRREINVFSNPSLDPVPGIPHLKKNQIKDIDLMVVLGGDGTLLRAVRLLEGRPVPILGVNLGNLGFLTETREGEVYEVLDLAIKGKLDKRKRNTLQASVKGKDDKEVVLQALNDIVIERGPESRLIDMTINYDENFVSNVRADGLIIATPTGTTAYCLAAGGPIVHPHVNALVVTPICPHTLTNRPLILCDEAPIRLKLNPYPSEAVMMVDGERFRNLTVDDELIISKGKNPVTLLSLPSRNYFEVLRAKLSFGVRE